MSKKDLFISEVENFVEKLSDEAREYFEEIKKSPFQSKEITDKGKVILKDMQDNCGDETSIFTSKEIADRLGISGRSVSGSMRSLISLGYAEKVSNNPVQYALTQAGKDYVLDK